MLDPFWPNDGLVGSIELYAGLLDRYGAGLLPLTNCFLTEQHELREALGTAPSLTDGQTRALYFYSVFLDSTTTVLGN